MADKRKCNSKRVKGLFYGLYLFVSLLETALREHPSEIILGATLAVVPQAATLPAERNNHPNNTIPISTFITL